MFRKITSKEDNAVSSRDQSSERNNRVDEINKGNKAASDEQGNLPIQPPILEDKYRRSSDEDKAKVPDD